MEKSPQSQTVASSRPFPSDPAAYRFAAPAPALSPASEADGTTRPRTFTGVAYSGGVIANHPLFGALAIDLADIALPGPCPTLLGHQRDRRVGVCTLEVRDGALHCTGRLLRNADAQALAADADDGFPWQLSVHADPAGIDEIPAGFQVTINGAALDGPLVIFRRVRIHELSFTPTGYDSQTSALVMSIPNNLAPSKNQAPSIKNGLPPSKNQAPSIKNGLSPSKNQAPSIKNGLPPSINLSPSKNEEHAMTIEELQAQLAAETARAEAAEARVQEIESRAAAQARGVRLAAVKATFAELGCTLSDDDAAPYLPLSDDDWAKVKGHLATRSAPPEHLFEEQATGGVDANRAQADAALVERMAKL